MIDLVLATRNRDKQREISQIVGPGQFRLLSLNDFPSVPAVIEDGLTLAENAMKKAQSCYDATGIPSLADDTGLEVEALNGQPGVQSSRYAGLEATYGDNVAKLLQEMRDVPEAQRQAQFRTVVIILASLGEVYRGEGILKGRIAFQPSGTGGFGYDPVFFVPESGKTLAELSAAEKNRVSHRTLAVRGALRNWMEESR